MTTTESPASADLRFELVELRAERDALRPPRWMR
jgi:hypothetical protein